MTSSSTNVQPLLQEAEFEAAYLQYRPVHERLLISKGVLADEAKDLIQSAWARAWEKRFQFRGAGQEPYRLRAWVTQIALNIWRVQRRRAAKFTPLPPGFDHIQQPSALRAETELASVLAKVSCSQREILYAHLEGKPISRSARWRAMQEVRLACSLPVASSYYGKGENYCAR